MRALQPIATGECRLLTGDCFGCGQQGHFLRDCPYKRDTEAGISEPTVQQLRQGGTGATAGRGRGQGQAASSLPTRGKPGTQTYQQQGQARAFAMTYQEATAAPDGDKGKKKISS